MHKDNLGIKSNISFKFLGSLVSSMRSIIISKNLSFCASLSEIFFSIKSLIISDINLNELL